MSARFQRLLSVTLLSALSLPLEAQARIQPLTPPLIVNPADSLVDTLHLVPGADASESSSLLPGVSYRLVVTGLVVLGRCDGAACPGGHAGIEREGDAGYVTADRWYSYGPADGLAPGGVWINGARPDWGPMRPDHIYTVDLTGTGQPLYLEMLDGDGLLEDNGGQIDVQVFRMGGEPLSSVSWGGIPEVRSADGAAWIEPRGLTAAASITMISAALGRLPAWPGWVFGGQDDASRQTDWGQYVGHSFQLPGLGAWKAVATDPVGMPVSGIAGAVGFDPEAGARVGEVFKRLGVNLELRVDPGSGPVDFGGLGQALQEAAGHGWPTMLELVSDEAVRFVVMAGAEYFEDRLELVVLDPELGGLARYRLYAPQREGEPIADAVPVIDGVAGFWAGSSQTGLAPRVNDFLLDDGSPWFVLNGEGLTSGRSFDRGLGAPVLEVGGRGWGLTWVETTGVKETTGEGIWRVVAPESGEYVMWAYVAPEIDPGQLVKRVAYHMSTMTSDALTEKNRVGVVKTGEEGREGWHRVGGVHLKEGDVTYVRVPVVGEKGRRIVLDGLRLVRE